MIIEGFVVQVHMCSSRAVPHCPLSALMDSGVTGWCTWTLIKSECELEGPWVKFGNELCDVALAGENITNLKCLGLFCSLGNFFWVVYNDTGYIDIWVITLFMGLVIASLNWNLVTLVTFKSSTNALVCLQQMFLSCFMITLFTFKQSWQGLCGESTWPKNVLFYK